jgi:glycine/D-amino acid oxidase-like deaminating enzyme
MKKRVLILGAGFAGLELSTCLSEAHGDGIAVTVLDIELGGDRIARFGATRSARWFGRTGA